MAIKQILICILITIISFDVVVSHEENQFPYGMKFLDNSSYTNKEAIGPFSSNPLIQSIHDHQKRDESSDLKQKNDIVRRINLNKEIREIDFQKRLELHEQSLIKLNEWDKMTDEDKMKYFEKQNALYHNHMIQMDKLQQDYLLTEASKNSQNEASIQFLQ